MEVKREVEAVDSLAEQGEARGDAGLVVGTETTALGLVCELQVPAPPSIRDSQKVLTDVGELWREL